VPAALLLVAAGEVPAVLVPDEEVPAVPARAGVVDGVAGVPPAAAFGPLRVGAADTPALAAVEGLVPVAVVAVVGAEDAAWALGSSPSALHAERIARRVKLARKGDGRVSCIWMGVWCSRPDGVLVGEHVGVRVTLSGAGRAVQKGTRTREALHGGLE
jgi:hypothetical protein